MKRAFVVIAALTALVLSGCASLLGGTPQSDKSYRLSYTPAIQNRATISFDGREYLKAQEDKRAAKELRAPNYAGLPGLAVVVVSLADGNIDGANPKNSAYILQDNTGKELYRANGKSVVPSPDTSAYMGNVSTVWTAYDSFRIDDTDVEFPLKMRIVRFGNETVDIIISKATAQ